METKFKNNFKIGKHDDETEVLRAPSWDCGWYWSAGYLGNKYLHHHLDGLNKDRNLYDALKEYYGDSLTIKDDADLWQFCELMASFYALQKTAEVLGRGGAHYTTNPVAEVIKNEAEAKRINEKVMPAIFDALESLLAKYR